MLTDEDINEVGEQFNNLSDCYKWFYDGLRKLKGENVSSSLIQKSEEYMKNMDARTNRLKNVYNIFEEEIGASCTKFMENVNSIEEEDKKEVEGIKNDFEKIREEIRNKNDKLAKNEELK